MSFQTWLGNLRSDRRIVQEKINALQAPAMAHAPRPVWVVPVALAFVMMLMALAVPPAAAITINLSVITDVVNAFIGLIEPITNLIIAIVPLWFILEILGFLMGLLTAVLAMVTFKKIG